MVSVFGEMVTVVAEMVCVFCNHVGAASENDGLGNVNLNTATNLREIDRSCGHHRDVYHNLKIVCAFYPVAISILKYFAFSSIF